MMKPSTSSEKTATVKTIEEDGSKRELSTYNEDTTNPVKAVEKATTAVDDVEVKSLIKTPKKRKAKDMWVIL